jgi:hypothetical protein
MTVATQACERLSLGGLIDLLKKQDPKHGLRFDFGGVCPTGISSYRGYYEDLAIEFSDQPDEWPTVESFLTTLREAVGKTFGGYKGGDFVMTGRSRIWVANYSHTSDTTIVGIRDCDYMTVLHTSWEEG